MRREILSYLVIAVTLVVLSVLLIYSVIEYLMLVPRVFYVVIVVSLMFLCIGFICGRVSLSSEVKKLKRDVERLRRVSITPRGDALTLPFDTELLGLIINRSLIRFQTTQERVEGVRE